MNSRPYDFLDLILILYFIVLGIIVLRSHYLRQIAPLFSIHRARPYRSLSSTEVQELKSVGDNPEITEPVSIWMWTKLLLKIIVVLGLIGTTIFAYVPALPNIWSALFVFLGTVLSYIVFSDTMGKQLKKDFTSPVYLLQDTMWIETVNKRRDYDFRVGRYEFKYKLMLIDAYTKSQTIKDGDSVTIEFSPNSNYVWKIERL